MDLIRTCFSSAKEDASPTSTSLSDIETNFQQQIERDFHRQAVVMRGIYASTSSTSSTSSKLAGKQQTQQPVLVKFPRHEGGTTEQEYLLSQLYIAERAVACTEFATQGLEEKLVVIMDGSHHSSHHTPPLSWQLSAVRRVQQLYPYVFYKK